MLKIPLILLPNQQPPKLLLPIPYPVQGVQSEPQQPIQISKHTTHWLDYPVKWSVIRRKFVGWLRVQCVNVGGKWLTPYVHQEADEDFAVPEWIEADYAVFIIVIFSWWSYRLWHIDSFLIFLFLLLLDYEILNLALHLSILGQSRHIPINLHNILTQFLTLSFTFNKWQFIIFCNVTWQSFKFSTDSSSGHYLWEVLMKKLPNMLLLSL